MKRLFIFVCVLFMFGAANAACKSGYYNVEFLDNTFCTKCPAGTTTPEMSYGQHSYTQCAPAWLRYTYNIVGSNFNLVRDNAIPLYLEKQTTPALAMRVGDKTMYAVMAPVEKTTVGKMYVKYDNQIYKIGD